MKITRAEKLIVLLNCTVPVALLGYDAIRGNLGANPVNFAIRTTGMLALIFLTLSLAITPAARLTGWNWLVVFRRTLGLYAFFHGLLHLTIFFVWDRALSLSSTFSEMLIRPYLVVGSAALFLMLPLAVTSTDGMIRRLGPKNWKRLHRLAYVSAILGVIHYYMLVKADISQPVAFAIALGLLLGFRVVYSGVRRFRTKSAGRATAMATPTTSLAMANVPRKPKFWTGQLRVARIFDETPDVRTFRFTGVDLPALPFDFIAGQYLNVSLMIDGKKINRSYTIASSPSRSAYCEITVKRDGLASKHLHLNVREGDLINVSAPAGRFTFTGSESDNIVMIAGGVGITPLMTKIRYLTDISWPGQIHLAYSAKTDSDLIFREELEYLQRRHKNLHVLTTLTRADGQAWPGARGRLTGEALLAHAPHLRESVIHICGPDAMLEPTKQMLRDLGVTDSRIYFESFSTPSRMGVDAEPSVPAETQDAAVDTNAVPLGTATITFARSNRSAEIPSEMNVLEAAEDLGVNIDFDCRSGICGQCKTRLLSGSVKMTTQDALSRDDLANNFILACQAHCQGAVVVDA